MNLRLAFLRLHVPARLRFAGLRGLAGAASSAFGRPAPAMEGVPYPEALRRLVEFMGEVTSIRGRDGATDRARLHGEALALGRRLRTELGVRNRDEARAALEILYGAIGIDWRSDPGGGVTVRRCAFASRFTPEACALASALDRGIVEGLTAGGRLQFLERLTEGRPACLARIDFPGEAR